MADRITLTGLELFGHHGVFAHEKRDGQRFVVDLTIWAELTQAVATDDLARTVDYGELARVAERVVTGPPRDLIEAVAGEIADEIMRDHPVHAVEVTIHKPSAPIPLTFADVSVTIRRSIRREGVARAGAAR